MYLTIESHVLAGLIERQASAPLMLSEISNLIASKEITSIYFFLNIIKNIIIAICNNSITQFLKFIEVINNLTAKEQISVGS